MPEDRPLIAVITALPVEFAAVKAKLKNVVSKATALGGVYAMGTFTADGGRRKWNVALTCIGAGNPGAALAAGDAISELRPDALCFLGIAGGIKDVNHGDVVVASKVYGYERGKAHADGFVPSPEVARSNLRLVTHFTSVSLDDKWKRRTASSDRSRCLALKLLVSPIAAGEKVIKSDLSQIAVDVRRYFNDAVAVEMEGLGTLAAAAHRDNVPAIVIRGISDLLGDKSAEHDAAWQPIASRNAAAALFQGLSLLDADWLRGGTSEEGFNGQALAPSLAETVISHLPQRDRTINSDWSAHTIIRSIQSTAASREWEPVDLDLDLDLELDDFVDIQEWSRSERAVVYRATRLNYGVKLGRVAIKEWPKGSEDFCIAEAQWASEVDLNTSWQCTEIRRLIGEPFRGGLVTISPWYGDETLADLVQKEPLTLAEAKKLWVDMTNVLVDLFAMGIVHGDIKPDNIINSRSNWVLIDYGVAGHTGPSRQVVGTPAYMAPELFEKARNPLSDVYSLAMTVHYSITGKLRDSWGRYRDYPSALDSTSVSTLGSEPTESGLPQDWAKLLANCLDEAQRRPDPTRLLSMIELLSE